MYFSSLHIFFFAKFIVLLYIYQCVPTTLHEIFLNQLFPKVLARDAAHAFTSSYHTSSPVWDQHFDCLSQSSSSSKNDNNTSKLLKQAVKSITLVEKKKKTIFLPFLCRREVFIALPVPWWQEFFRWPSEAHFCEPSSLLDRVFSSPWK